MFATLLPLAEDDLVEAWVEIALDSPANADRYISDLRRRFSTLAEFPKMGHPAEEVKEGLWMFSIENFIVFYVPSDDGIDIARVWHTSRDISNIFFDD